MRFKAKLRRIGNSLGILIPKSVITSYNIGEEIELDVITKEEETEKEVPKVITPKARVTGRKKQKYQGNPLYQLCPKHPGSYKITCGCK